jgi:hypothetical protein
MFEQRKHKTLEKRRMEALGDIRGERLAFETMVQRSQRAGENSDETFLTSVRQRLAEIEQKAINEADID